jgi:hypothetical protein
VYCIPGKHAPAGAVARCIVNCDEQHSGAESLPGFSQGYGMPGPGGAGGAAGQPGAADTWGVTTAIKAIPPFEARKAYCVKTSCLSPAIPLNQGDRIMSEQPDCVFGPPDMARGASWKSRCEESVRPQLPARPLKGLSATQETGMLPILAGTVIGYFLGGKKGAIAGAAAGAGWNYASSGKLAGLSEDFYSDEDIDETQYGAAYPVYGAGLPQPAPQQAGRCVYAAGPRYLTPEERRRADLPFEACRAAGGTVSHDEPVGVGAKCCYPGQSPIPQYDGYSDYNTWYWGIYVPWMQAQKAAMPGPLVQPMRCVKRRDGRVICTGGKRGTRVPYSAKAVFLEEPFID